MTTFAHTGSWHPSPIVIIGAGPYGLSLAAHLATAGLPFRIFGEPMKTWATQTPAGMKLKSDGFASNLTTGGVPFTLEDFCALNNLPYHATQIPVAVEHFVAYGREFARRFVPQLDTCDVVEVERAMGGGFCVLTARGEQLHARHVVIATGVSLYSYVPSMYEVLPQSFVSHSSAVQTFDHLAGKSVAVLGRGASSLNAATLLAEAGAQPTLISRSPRLHMHTLDDPHARPLRDKLLHPMSPLGPSLRSWLSCHLPHLFQRLPLRLRRLLTYKHLGPAGGAALQGRLDSFPRLMGWTVTGAAITQAGTEVRLQLRSRNGETRSIEVSHIIAGTGYRICMGRLGFLSETLRNRLRVEEGGSPRLDAHFTSSEPGLYFIGPSAASSFGPLQRFSAGAEYAATRLTRHLRKQRQRESRNATDADKELIRRPQRSLGTELRMRMEMQRQAPTS